VTRSPAVAPWQVWLVDFGQPAGSEQGGRRPAIIVGSADHCRFPIDVALVIPVTSRDRGLPHHVPIQSAESGLDRPSWARTEDIRAVSARRFRQPVPLGHLADAEISQVRTWIHRMLG
jgi:mRNA interferase MazF